MCAAHQPRVLHIVTFVRKLANEARTLGEHDRVARLEIIPELSMRELLAVLGHMLQAHVLRIEDERGGILVDFDEFKRNVVEFHVLYAIVVAKKKRSTRSSLARCVIS